MAILATRVNARPLLVTAAILAAIIPLLLAAVFLVQSVANQALVTQKTVRSARLSRDSAVTLQLNEETGIRGYVATRDRRFLAPYTLGTGQLPAILSQLHGALVNLNVREAIAATDSAREINAQWLKSFAAPILKDPNQSEIALQFADSVSIDKSGGTRIRLTFRRR